MWNALAEDVEPHRPPFDHKANISGQDLFVSAYHGFYTLGNEHLPVPRAFDNFLPYSIDLRDAHVESGTLVIPVVVVLGGEENPGRYRMQAKLQLTTPGKGCHPVCCGIISRMHRVIPPWSIFAYRTMPPSSAAARIRARYTAVSSCSTTSPATEASTSRSLLLFLFQHCRV